MERETRLAMEAAGADSSVRLAAAELVSFSSPRSTAIIKRQVYDALLQNLGGACAVSETEEALSFASADFKEGVAHFVEKRVPAFTGARRRMCV